MSVVATRERDGYQIHVGNFILADGDPAGDYEIWIDAPDGTPIVEQQEVSGRISAVWEYCEGEVDRIISEQEYEQQKQGVPWSAPAGWE